jgi:hypothetical protein
VNSLISSALLARKPPKFAFITITNPTEIKDSRKKTTIRRHARASTNQPNIKRRKQFKLTFDIPYIESQDTGTVQPTNLVQNEAIYVGSIGVDASGQTNRSSSSEPLSLSLLRPLGSGRGLLPMQSFPVDANSRIRELTNFGMISV